MWTLKARSRISWTDSRKRGHQCRSERVSLIQWKDGQPLPVPNKWKDFVVLQTTTETLLKTWQRLQLHCMNSQVTLLFIGTKTWTFLWMCQKCMNNCPSSHHTNSRRKLHLDTDASDIAIGAKLSQVQNGVESCISYCKFTFTPVQKKNCTTRKELLAVVSLLVIFVIICLVDLLISARIIAVFRG